MGVEIKNEITSKIDTEEGGQLSAGQKILVQVDGKILIDFTVPANVDTETGIRFAVRLWGKMTVSPEIVTSTKAAMEYIQSKK